jgi:hypothetical protein
LLAKKEQFAEEVFREMCRDLGFVAPYWSKTYIEQANDIIAIQHPKQEYSCLGNNSFLLSVSSNIPNVHHTQIYNCVILIQFNATQQDPASFNP